jgi:hypothetical protein
MRWSIGTQKVPFIALNKKVIDTKKQTNNSTYTTKKCWSQKRIGQIKFFIIGRKQVKVFENCPGGVA